MPRLFNQSVQPLQGTSSPIHTEPSRQCIQNLCVPLPPAVHRQALHDSDAHTRSLCCSSTRRLSLLYRVHTSQSFLRHLHTRLHTVTVRRPDSCSRTGVQWHLIERVHSPFIRACAAFMHRIRCERLTTLPALPDILCHTAALYRAVRTRTLIEHLPLKHPHTRCVHFSSYHQSPFGCLTHASHIHTHILLQYVVVYLSPSLHIFLSGTCSEHDCGRWPTSIRSR